MSRPSKLTSALAARIAESLRVGQQPATAARNVAIGKTTLYRWLARGRAARRCSGCPCRSTCTRPADEPYVELDSEVLKARSDRALELAALRNFEALLGPMRRQGIRRRVVEEEAIAL